MNQSWGSVIQMIEIDPNDYSFDMHEQFERMAKATTLLRTISAIQQHMRWQFGEPPELRELEAAMLEAHTGWMASNC